MATQIAYAQEFLSYLATLSITIAPDHVEDPRHFPARPAFTLPKMLTPMVKKSPNPAGPSASSAATSSSPSTTINVILKSPRNPPLTVMASSQDPTTSIGSLRTLVSTQTQTPLPKVKILYNKKPVVDSKILKELLGDEAATEVEFGIMIMGGATVVGTAVSPAGKDEELEAKRVLGTEKFWKELADFVSKKAGNESVSKDVIGIFRTAYEAKQ